MCHKCLAKVSYNNTKVDKKRCSKNHNLVVMTHLPHPYYGNYNCDRCKKTNYKIAAGVWHCEQNCNYDVCFKCVPDSRIQNSNSKKSTTACNKGHGLKLMVVLGRPYGKNFSCDVCKTLNQINKGVWHC